MLTQRANVTYLLLWLWTKLLFGTCVFSNRDVKPSLNRHSKLTFLVRCRSRLGTRIRIAGAGIMWQPSQKWRLDLISISHWLLVWSEDRGVQTVQDISEADWPTPHNAADVTSCSENWLNTKGTLPRSQTDTRPQEKQNASSFKILLTGLEILHFISK